jgi:hypothetical protein
MISDQTQRTVPIPVILFYVYSTFAGNDFITSAVDLTFIKIVCVTSLLTVNFNLLCIFLKTTHPK